MLSAIRADQEHLPFKKRKQSTASSWLHLSTFLPTLNSDLLPPFSRPCVLFTRGCFSTWRQIQWLNPPPPSLFTPHCVAAISKMPLKCSSCSNVSQPNAVGLTAQMGNRGHGASFLTLADNKRSIVFLQSHSVPITARCFTFWRAGLQNCTSPLTD